MPVKAKNIVDLEDLSLSFMLQNRQLAVLEGISIQIAEGESVGLVGESGSGKSTIARALLGLLPEGITRLRRGRLLIGGQDVTNLTQAQWEKVRGKPVAIIFQDPLSYLNPVMTIGKQVSESVKRHTPELPVKVRVEELLRVVMLPEACVGSYPYELSGGMQQRALLAIALGCQPSLLVADEPTTALDVTTQAEILALLKDLRNKIGMAVLLISHDLGIISKTCDRLYVIYAGQVMESGNTGAIFDNPVHPYTHGLLLAAAAVRTEDGLFSTIPGDPPSLQETTKGCPFEPRCNRALALCAEHLPKLEAISSEESTHLFRCWHPHQNLTAAEKSLP